MPPPLRIAPIGQGPHAPHGNETVNNTNLENVWELNTSQLARNTVVNATKGLREANNHSLN